MFFFISDTHFGHANIIKYCDRPFVDDVIIRAVDLMDEYMIDKWNSTVGPDDIVIHGGDFAFMSTSRAQKLYDRLNGHKFLIHGNHDKDKKKMREIGFDDVLDYWSCELQGKKVFVIHDPDMIGGSSSYKDRETGETVVVDTPTNPEYAQMADEADIVLYGHHHNNPHTVPAGWINISVEEIGYTPRSLEELM